MYIHWKPLLTLGFVFWILIFSTDVLKLQKIILTELADTITQEKKSKFSIENIGRLTSGKMVGDSSSYSLKRAALKEQYMRLQELNMENETKNNSDQKHNMVGRLDGEASMKEKSINFSLSLLIANILIFVFSLIFCSIAKVVTSLVWRVCSVTKEPSSFEITPLAKNLSIKNESSPLAKRSSDTDLTVKSKLSTELSCPNLLLKRSDEDIKLEQTHKNCQTIFHPQTSHKTDNILRGECVKLREELLNLHTNSLKEHALLSRKLDSITKEKKELSKRLLIVQKENQVAKVQIGELMNERTLLQSRLENATKEFKVNTRTKKIALAKLEDISSTVDDLKKQLEQVTRDKEILEAKLEVMRGEYEQLQNRLRYYQNKNKMLDQQAAEKDVNVAECLSERESFTSLKEADAVSQTSLNGSMSKESVFLPYVISQTEVDMKNIQLKILQLEKNLNNFNCNNPVFREDRPELLAESDVHQKITLDQTGDNIRRVISKISNASNNNYNGLGEATCRKKYEEIKIQMLTNALKDKVKYLEQRKEKGEDDSQSAITDTTTTEQDEGSLEDRTQRIVSNSAAFQQFLKNIGTEKNYRSFNCVGANEQNVMLL